MRQLDYELCPIILYQVGSGDNTLDHPLGIRKSVITPVDLTNINGSTRSSGVLSVPLAAITRKGLLLLSSLQKDLNDECGFG